MTKKHLVFIDDDHNILSALKRAFRKKKNEWNIFYFSNPENALQHLEQNPADLIICDMLMPKMSGSELLELVKTRWPHTQRWIFSGELGSSKDTINIAQRVVKKPCTPQELESLLEEELRIS